MTNALKEAWKNVRENGLQTAGRVLLLILVSAGMMWVIELSTSWLYVVTEYGSEPSDHGRVAQNLAATIFKYSMGAGFFLLLDFIMLPFLKYQRRDSRDGRLVAQRRRLYPRCHHSRILHLLRRDHVGARVGACVNFSLALVVFQFALHAEVFKAEIARAGVERFEPIYHSQVTQESAWIATAESRYAQGLTQFTPPTRGDIYPQTKPSCANASPFDPACSFRAMILYDGRLLYAKPPGGDYARPLGDGSCRVQRWQGNLNREKRDCEADLLCNPKRWFGNLEDFCTVRSAANCRENRSYPRKILRRAGVIN